MIAGSKDDAEWILALPKARRLDLIWNLAEELAFMAEAESAYCEQVLCSMVPDYGVPKGEEFLNHLQQVVECLKGDGMVFVHCNGGHGRTGMAVAAILKRFGASNEEALRVAKKYCQGPETVEQHEWIINS